MKAKDQDTFNVDMICGSDEAATMGSSPHEIERTSKKAPRRPPRRALLSARMPSGLRRSSMDLAASFSKSLTTGRIDEDGGDEGDEEDSSHRQLYNSAPACTSAAQAAQLVAHEYFGQGRAGPSDSFAATPSRTNPHRLHNSVAGSVSATQAARLVASEYFGKALLDDDEGDSGRTGSSQEKDHTRTTFAESRRSTLSSEDTIALEVGVSALEYLEECFYTEVSVLDRDKFNAIPEIVKSDFVITEHLGKGSFSDVFEVIYEGGQLSAKGSDVFSGGTKANRRRSARLRGRRTALSSSITTATLARPTCGDRQNVFALKCLRPQIRSDAEKFTIGAEDLVHETAILSSLDHPHIIKLHGRASGNLTDAFVLNDGYFILLDRLKETLHDRIATWKLSPRCFLQGLTVKQIEVAQSIADAVSYLHSKKIVFRDLKPDNVGFDSMGVLKLFDFGFAIGLPGKDESNPAGFLFDRCGTPRYMAPEVGLSLGYGLKADMYSFGMLLWELCSLVKPFASISSSDKFETVVFMEGKRPTIKNHWPTTLKELLSSCWSTPSKRPDQWMDIKSSLSLVMTDITSEKKSGIRAIRSSLAKGRL